MDFTGRPMTGFVLVGRAGIAKDAALAGWIDWALDYVGTLPAKKPKKRPPPRARAKKTARKGK